MWDRRAKKALYGLPLGTRAIGYREIARVSGEAIADAIERNKAALS
jgi:hypothetical protein